MKRKRPPTPEPEIPETIVPDALIEEAKRAIETDHSQPSAKCVVCGSACATNSAEGLCWVCRRLKLSAWRDNDISQMPAQE